ncbi:MAG: DUF3995 domain-containing protein [Sulfurimonas sp.]|nr:MAG: DUF3995 domain-containing protein [Sulfurimonas sp.]
MHLIAVSTIIILTVISFFHFYWVFGGKIGLDKSLPTTPDGKRLLNPAKPLTFLVGIVILSFAFVVYKLYYDYSNDLYSFLGWAICIVFLLRSIGEFNTVGFFKRIKNTPFAKYDTLFYSPLCLYLALAYAFLASNI